MKTFLIIAFLILLPATAAAWSGTVVNVHDGDTVTVERTDSTKRPDRADQPNDAVLPDHTVLPDQANRLKHASRLQRTKRSDRAAQANRANPADPASQADHAKRVKVRIYGVDCPELDQPFGIQARELTAGLLLGKTVEVVPIHAKSYSRDVAGVILVQDMLILQDVLTSSGLAWVDDRYCKTTACAYWRQHQKDAQSATPPRGLWAADKPLSPRKWRAQRKKAAR